MNAAPESAFIPRAHAEESVFDPVEPLVFNPVFGTIDLPSFGCQHYAWKDQEQYKSDRLHEYQDMLCDAGIKDTEALRLLSGQLAQENGSFSETHTTGDGGCAVGIVQYNACVHHGISAKKFLERNPEWQDYRFQLQWMADRVKEKMAKYDGNLRLVVIAHNSPACAARGCSDTKAGYFKAVSRMADQMVPVP